MVFDYYCGKCKVIVMPAVGTFQHPHLGEKGGLVCPKCGYPVYIRERDGH